MDRELAVYPLDGDRVALRIVDAVVHHRDLAAVGRHVGSVHGHGGEGGAHLGDVRARRQ